MASVNAVNIYCEGIAEPSNPADRLRLGHAFLARLGADRLSNRRVAFFLQNFVNNGYFLRENLPAEGEEDVSVDWYIVAEAGQRTVNSLSSMLVEEIVVVALTDEDYDAESPGVYVQSMSRFGDDARIFADASTRQTEFLDRMTPLYPENNTDNLRTLSQALSYLTTYVQIDVPVSEQYL